MEVCANGSEQCLTKFSLDLVSPVEYLFRKYSRDNNSMYVVDIYLCSYVRSYNLILTRKCSLDVVFEMVRNSVVLIIGLAIGDSRLLGNFVTISISRF